MSVASWYPRHAGRQLIAPTVKIPQQNSVHDPPKQSPQVHSYQMDWFDARVERLFVRHPIPRHEQTSYQSPVAE